MDSDSLDSSLVFSRSPQNKQQINTPISSGRVPPPVTGTIILTPMMIIQRQINGENIRATPQQIDSFLASKPTGEFRAILDTALSRRVIDPDVALLEFIKSFRSRENIYSIAIALRLGANANMYIYDPDSGIAGTMHILGYLYYNGKKHSVITEPYFNTVVLLLLHYGSKPMMAIYDKTGGSIKSMSEETQMGRNVFDWLSFGDYPHILDVAYPRYRDIIDDRTKNIMSILTGDRSLIAVPFTEVDIEKIIMARNTRKGMENNKRESRTFDISSYGHYNLLPDCPDPHAKDNIQLDWMVLIWALNNYDDDATGYYTSMGYIYSYPLMTKLLILMKKHYLQGDVFLFGALARILELNVGSGYIMDLEQLNYLETISSVSVGRIKSIYAQPYWSKICSFTPSPALSLGDVIPNKLRATAISLGIENPTSHQNVCLQLRRMTESDSGDLKTAAKNRQLSRLGAKHGYISDFTAGTCPPVLYCVNRKSVDGDCSDYSDMALSSYRDGNGDVWCFLSTNYQYMLETKKNPISGSELPLSYLNEIEIKLGMLRDLGADIGKPTKLSQTIDDLMKPDEVDNLVSQAMLERLYSTSSGQVSQNRINSLSQEQIQSILQSTTYSIDLSDLTKTHSLYILAYIVDLYSRTSQNNLKIVLDRLRTI